MPEPDSWAARMAARAAERNETSVERERGIPPPVDPPDDGTCLDCYEWRYYPVGQRHFGQCWWRTCDQRCRCEHHKDEIWLAADWDSPETNAQIAADFYAD